MEEKGISLSKAVMVWFIYTLLYLLCASICEVWSGVACQCIEINPVWGCPQVGRHNHKRALLVLVSLAFDFRLSLWLDWRKNKSCYRLACEVLFRTIHHILIQQVPSAREIIGREICRTLPSYFERTCMCSSVSLKICVQGYLRTAVVSISLNHRC